MCLTVWSSSAPTFCHDCMNCLSWIVSECVAMVLLASYEKFIFIHVSMYCTEEVVNYFLLLLTKCALKSAKELYQKYITSASVFSCSFYILWMSHVWQVTYIATPRTCMEIHVFLRIEVVYFQHCTSVMKWVLDSILHCYDTMLHNTQCSLLLHTLLVVLSIPSCCTLFSAHHTG